MAASLLEESDGEEGAPVRLKINEEYARRLEHNKKREDLHRLQELQKRGLVGSDSEEDDESEDEDGFLPERTEVKIFDTLAKIKNKDPSIYKGDVKFFEEDEEDDDDDEDSALKEAKKKPVYLKDVVAQNALEENSDEEDGKKTFKTYAEEQQELKDEFLKSFAEASAPVEDEDVDSLFKVRKKSKAELEEEEASNKDVEISRKLEEYFGKDNDLDENDKFLKDYLRNQGWIDKNRDKLPSYEDVVGKVSEDEAELDKQDKYEAKFNFRFEEGAGDQVPGHARFMENSVRKLPEKRKEQRIKKKARISEAELARQEEVKRLKNVKKKEIMEKMEKIKTIAGMNNLKNLDEDDLEEDFNPEEYDKKMQKVFGEEYYEEKDPNFQSDGEDEKPDFEVEDEALGLPKGWESAQGFAAMHKQMEVSKKLQEEKELLKEEVEKKLEEYYKLDYEDVIGNMPTRFKYTQVKPNTYDLTAAEVLGLDDKELNQYVSLKALAPYRTEEWIPRHKHIKLTKKERKRRALDQVPSLDSKNRKHKEDHVTNPEEQKTVEEDQVSNIENKNKKHKKQKRVQEDQASKKEAETKEEDLHEDGTLNEAFIEDNSNAAAEQESGKKKKRKRKKPGLNMSKNRLISYGKIDLPKKRKH